MDVVLLVVRLILSLVLMLAGVAKLVDRAGTRQAVRDFGVPAMLAAPLAAALPVAELAVAVALVPTGSAWWAALGALALLLAFTVAVGYQLARGRAPRCHCFGQISNEPVGVSTLVRNLFLAALAGLAVGAGRPGTGISVMSGRLDPAADIHRLTQYLDVVTMAVLTLASMAVIIWRQQGHLAQRLRDLEADLAGDEAEAVPAPRFSLPDTSGDAVSLDDLLAGGRRLLLIFSDPDCGACAALLPDVGRWQHEHAGTLTIAVISRGDAAANRAGTDPYRLAHVLLQHDREIAEAYQVHGTPCAVLVDTDRTVTGTEICGADRIRALVARVAGAPRRRELPVIPHPANAARPWPVADPAAQAPSSSALPIGATIPPVRLPDLDGHHVALADLDGAETLLLFWNPTCGHCAAMLPELRSWQELPTTERPALVVVSTGDTGTNRALGLSAPILLDNDLTAARLFGAGGTPMAVLLDAQGRIASPLAAGAPAIWSLVRPPQPDLPRTEPAIA